MLTVLTVLVIVALAIAGARLLNGNAIGLAWLILSMAILAIVVASIVSDEQAQRLAHLTDIVKPIIEMMQKSE